MLWDLLVCIGTKFNTKKKTTPFVLKDRRVIITFWKESFLEATLQVRNHMKEPKAQTYVCCYRSGLLLSPG